PVSGPKKHRPKAHGRENRQNERNQQNRWERRRASQANQTTTRHRPGDRRNGRPRTPTPRPAPRPTTQDPTTTDPGNATNPDPTIRAAGSALPAPRVPLPGSLISKVCLNSLTRLSEKATHFRVDMRCK